MKRKSRTWGETAWRDSKTTGLPTPLTLADTLCNTTQATTSAVQYRALPRTRGGSSPRSPGRGRPRRPCGCPRGTGGGRPPCRGGRATSGGNRGMDSLFVRSQGAFGAEFWAPHAQNTAKDHPKRLRKKNTYKREQNALKASKTLTQSAERVNSLDLWIEARTIPHAASWLLGSASSELQ